MIQGKPPAATSAALEAFRNGATMEEVKAAASTESQPKETSTKELQARITKTLRVSKLHCRQLREFAAKRTNEEDVKVTESDLLGEALTEYFKTR